LNRFAFAATPTSERLYPNRVPAHPHREAKLTSIATNPNPRIFLSAGEASGDHYGAEIISELRTRLPDATFTGLGGTVMEAAGQQRIVRAENVAHMGLTEVLRHAFYIHSQYRSLVRALKRNPPTLAIFIDFPDVNFRLAMHCKRLGVPVLWFVSPQLWAWKRRRLRWVQRFVDRMLVIFPFEAPFYRARNVDAEFVGHPLATLPLPTISREAYAAEHGLDPTKQWIALLPGSRQKEIKSNLSPMIGLAVAAATPDDADFMDMLGISGRPSDSILDYGEYEFVLPVASTIAMDQLQSEVRRLSERWTKFSRSTIPGLHLHLVSDARAALHHARASVVASGTATVQALTIGNPFVVVYRVSPLTYAILKRLVRYPAEIPAQPDADGNLPIAMPNLIAGRRIVPELLNQRFTAQNLASALRPLLDDTPARAQMIADLAEARTRLLPTPDSHPIQRVCDAAEVLLRSTAPSGVPRTPVANV
jgi:lipid-A-disaccharide synthase